MAKKELSFEQAMEQLETIVAQLEEGKLSLNESLKQYEQGVQLTAFCEQMLKNAQLKITELQPEEPADA